MWPSSSVSLASSSSTRTWSISLQISRPPHRPRLRASLRLPSGTHPLRRSSCTSLSASCFSPSNSPTTWASSLWSYCLVTCWYTLIRLRCWSSLFSYSWMLPQYSLAITCRSGRARCSLTLSAWANGYLIRELMAPLPNKWMLLKPKVLISNNRTRWIIPMMNQITPSTRMRSRQTQDYLNQHRLGSRITLIQEAQLWSTNTSYIKQIATMETWASLTTLVQGYSLRSSTTQVAPSPASMCTLVFQSCFTPSLPSIWREE